MEYCDTLKRSLVPLICNVYPDSHHYYHDKDTTHTSKYTEEWLSKLRIKHSHMPTNSPDLNPIEYIWWMLDSRVARHHPQTFEDYRKYIVEEWDKITMEEIVHTVMRVRKLIPKVIEAIGGHVESVKTLHALCNEPQMNQ